LKVKKVFEKDFKRLSLKLAAERAGDYDLSDATARSAVATIPAFWEQQGQERKRGGEARAKQRRDDKRADIQQLALASLALRLENPYKHFNLRRIADRAKVPYKRAQDLSLKAVTVAARRLAREHSNDFTRIVAALSALQGQRLRTKAPT